MLEAIATAVVFIVIAVFYSIINYGDEIVKFVRGMRDAWRGE